ncbi:MAG: hypothetical protein KGM99_16395, partial [Burkholderiales bacterium]|nr:hypothetical protein [Burkholderiales bacterium]
MKNMRAFVVNLSLWRPGAALMRQLRFPAKMLLISAAFLLPLTWLFVAYTVSSKDNLKFVSNERLGVRYAKEVYGVLDAANAWGTQARRAAFGDEASDLATQRGRFEQAFQHLEKTDAELGAALGTKKSLDAVRQAIQAAQEAQASPDNVYPAQTALSRSLIALLDTVTDGSGL